ncbi:MAG: nucleotide exchange factor GrpE [Lachnospiraceae bacterium]|nr:nucleotide exchange factor GrpE [Lachnospiraceae bacterium]
MLFFSRRKNNGHNTANAEDSVQKTDSDILLQAISQIQQSQAEREENVLFEMKNLHQEQMQQMEKRLRKQEAMLEDLLDQLEEVQNQFKELKEDRSAEQEKMQYLQENEKLKQTLQNSQNENREQEKKLLEIIAAYDEYLRRIGADRSDRTEESDRQWDLVFQVLDQHLEAGQLKRIDGKGQMVDFETMMVLQAVETDYPDKKNRVKETVIPGWIYKGNVLQKAKVIAYRASLQTD